MNIKLFIIFKQFGVKLLSFAKYTILSLKKNIHEYEIVKLSRLCSKFTQECFIMLISRAYHIEAFWNNVINSFCKLDHFIAVNKNFMGIKWPSLHSCDVSYL
jgi:hypothetical protein